MTKSRNLVSNVAVAASGTSICGISTIVTSRRGHCRTIAVSKNSDILCIAVTAVYGILTSKRLYSCFGTGSRFCNRLDIYVSTCLYPCAVCVRISTCGSVGSHIRSVSVLKLSGGQGYLNVSRVLNKLIRNSLSSGLNLYYGAFLSNYVSSARGSVYGSLRCVYSSLNHDRSVYKVSFGTGVFSSGSIGYRLKRSIST